MTTYTFMADLTGCLIMLSPAFASVKTPVRKAEAYDSEIVVHFGFNDCRCLFGPGGADLLER
jgi:hypothetical protein